MKKRLAWLIAWGVLLGASSLSVGVANATGDDPPIWGICPNDGTTVCPTPTPDTGTGTEPGTDEGTGETTTP